MTFYTWLTSAENLKRDDPIGDLAKDARFDPSAKDAFTSRKKAVDYLLSKCACMECLDTLDDAYFEYREYLKKNKKSDDQDSTINKKSKEGLERFIMANGAINNERVMITAIKDCFDDVFRSMIGGRYDFASGYMEVCFENCLRLCLGMSDDDFKVFTKDVSDLVCKWIDKCEGKEQ